MTKTGCYLILIGAVLLGFNYGVISLSLLSKPLALPLMLILLGLFSIIKTAFNLGDLGEFASTILGILLFISIIMNIFNFSSFMIPSSAQPIIELSDSGMLSEFASLNFSIILEKAVVNYELDNETFIQSADYSENYSISTKFSNSYYDLTEFYGNALDFENAFGESTIINAAFFDSAEITNAFGKTFATTGRVFGDKEMRVINSFGEIIIFIDKEADYMIESSNSFGTIENNVGLLSKDYSSAENRIKIIIINSFGTAKIFRQ